MKLYGKTPEEKLRSAEKALTSLQRRRDGVTSWMIPPIPLSFFVNEFSEDLVVARYLFPASGILLRGIVLSDFSGKRAPFVLKANLIHGGETFQKGYTIAAKREEIEPNLDLAPGDRLELKIQEKPEHITRIWIGLLYQIDISEMHRHSVEPTVEPDDERVYPEVALITGS